MPGGGAAVLSLSPAGLHRFGLEQTRLLARTVNEHAAMDAIYHGNAERLLPRLRSKGT
jgi:hypothetical protein